jgi:hypothetical protein
VVSHELPFRQYKKAFPELLNQLHPPRAGIDIARAPSQAKGKSGREQVQVLTLHGGHCGVEQDGSAEDCLESPWFSTHMVLELVLPWQYYPCNQLIIKMVEATGVEPVSC